MSDAPEKDTPNRKPRPVVEHYLKVFVPPASMSPAERFRYEDSLGEAFYALSPGDMASNNFVRNVVEAQSDIVGYREDKRGILHLALQKALKNALQAHMDADSATRLLAQWIKQDAEATEQINNTLAVVGLSIESLEAHAFEAELDAIEAIDRVIVAAELRRKQALRELDRHSDVRRALSKKRRKIERAVGDPLRKPIKSPLEDDLVPWFPDEPDKPQSEGKPND